MLQNCIFNINFFSTLKIDFSFIGIRCSIFRQIGLIQIWARQIFLNALGRRELEIAVHRSSRSQQTNILLPPRPRPTEKMSKRNLKSYLEPDSNDVVPSPTRRRWRRQWRHENETETESDESESESCRRPIGGPVASSSSSCSGHAGLSAISVSRLDLLHIDYSSLSHRCFSASWLCIIKVVLIL